MPTAIKVENLSKAYQLGEIGTGTISRDLERYWAKLRGKEDPFLRIGETTASTSVSTSKNDIVWSLKDINFEINQGDAVGIIGRNGAGKSTLLKILSRVTAPTTGNIKVKGRIASLLEVGTGFHPELTGRENIFLNGAILGMRKAEIKKHFDAIVDFAGVERYVDTPVKRYSSGMYVRLAFAVAAHLESEILVVDEVLAVGDAEFQKKCLGKMGDLSTSEGRTVLFVSHDMSSIRSLCTKSILLKNGLIKNYSLSDAIIQEYLSDKQIASKTTGTREVIVLNLLIRNRNGILLSEVTAYDEVSFTLQIDCKKPIDKVSFALCFNNINKVRACSLWTNFNEMTYNLEVGRYDLTYKVSSFKLVPGIYELVTYIESKNNVIERIDEFREIIVGYDIKNSTKLMEPNITTGVYLQDFKTDLLKINDKKNI